MYDIFTQTHTHSHTNTHTHTQALKNGGETNTSYAEEYVKLRTDLRAHAVLKREEHRIQKGRV